MSNKNKPNVKPDVESMFVGMGKVYHGVRYPQGKTIRPPLCVVTVVPENGMAYNLLSKSNEKDSGFHGDFDWGKWLDAKSGLRLSYAILADLINEKIAKELAKPFAEAIISKLPELEWRLSGQEEIYKRYEAEIVMLGLGSIRG